MRNWIRARLAAAGYVVFNTRSPAQYAQDSLFTTNSDDFRRDPLFQAAYARGLRASHGVDPRHEWRVHVALWAAGLAARVPGGFCGVRGEQRVHEFGHYAAAGLGEVGSDVLFD